MRLSYRRAGTRHLPHTCSQSAPARPTARKRGEGFGVLCYPMAPPHSSDGGRSFNSELPRMGNDTLPKQLNIRTVPGSLIAFRLFGSRTKSSTTRWQLYNYGRWHRRPSLCRCLWRQLSSSPLHTRSAAGRLTRYTTNVGHRPWRRYRQEGRQ
jgi:hypothetical protein